jgi:hypothetical protein
MGRSFYLFLDISIFRQQRISGCCEIIRLEIYVMTRLHNQNQKLIYVYGQFLYFQIMYIYI